MWGHDINSFIANRDPRPMAGWGMRPTGALTQLEMTIAQSGDAELVARVELGRMRCRAPVHLLVDAAGEGWTARQAADVAGSSEQVASVTMDRTWPKHGLVVSCSNMRFSPSLQTVHFAPGGGVLVGLVQQALATWCVTGWRPVN